MYKLEFQCCYFKAIEPGLCHRIACHLRLLFPKHDQYMPYQVKEIREAADLAFNPLFLPRPESPPTQVPAHAVPRSHVPAAPYPPPPGPHTQKVPHLVSGSHAPAHSVPSRLNAAHTLHMPPKLHAPSDAKKAQPNQGLDRLLDVFIRQLEDRVTSSGRVDPRARPAQCSSPPSSLLSHSGPLPCGLIYGPSDCGLIYGPSDCGPANCGPANRGQLRVYPPSNLAIPHSAAGFLLLDSVPLPCGRSCGPAHLNGPDDHGLDDFGTFPGCTSQHGKVKSSY